MDIDMDMSNRVGVEYLVVWVIEGIVTQSKVILLDNEDPKSKFAIDWIRLAAEAEAFEPEQMDHLFKKGYQLILVCDFPEIFYV